MRNKNLKLITLFLVVALLMVGCTNNKSDKVNSETKKTIKIGCMSLTEYGAGLIAEQMQSLGYETELIVFDGNDLPAKALASGEIDALLGNHLPWIETFNESNGTDLTMVEPYFYYSPFALYSTKYKSVDEIPDGAKISIPNDPTNMQRSLLMLQDLGMITLGDKIGTFYMTVDIKENKKNIQFFEVEATATAANIKDVDAGFSAAIPIQQSGVMRADEWLYLDATCEEYPVGLVVNKENADAEWAVEAMKLMKQDQVMKAFDETVQGAFIQYQP